MTVLSRLGMGLGLMSLLACGRPAEPLDVELQRTDAAMALPSPRQCSSVPCMPNLARAATVTVSSTAGNGPGALDGRWTPDRALDGNRDSVDGALGWSSMASGSEYTTEWIRFDFGTPRALNEAQLYARNDETYGTVMGDGFPRDFVIEVSPDGVNWNAVVAQSNYPAPTDQLQSFRFGKVTTRFVRIRATRLDSVAGGSYHFQLAEIELYDNPDRLTYTFSDGEQAELTIDEGEAVVSEDILVADATELDGLFAEYQTYIYQTNARNTDGKVGGFSAGLNTHQRCKFWQVGCWKRKVVDSRWPNNTVYFEFHRRVSEANRQTIRGFINEWNDRAPVRWVEDTSRFSRVMFKVKKLRDACGNSIVGRSGLPQKIRIDPNCGLTRRTVQHEMGHAIGLIHEQQRCDRDSYITGVGNDSNNRKECAARFTTFGPYDYGSMMHYRSGTAVSPQPLGSVGDPWSPGGLQLGCHDRLGIHRLYEVAGGPGPTTADVATCNFSRNATVTVSSTTGNSPTQPDGRWTANWAVDGNRSSATTGYGWSSMASSSPSTSQWIRFDFPVERRVSRVDLYPRNDGSFGTSVGDGFPVNFTIELSTNGTTWTPVITRTNYPRPTGLQTFEFTAQPARFVRVLATQLRAVGGGGYYFQVAEVEIF